LNIKGGLLKNSKKFSESLYNDIRFSLADIKPMPVRENLVPLQIQKSSLL
jgi:hypothetical protein